MLWCSNTFLIYTFLGATNTSFQVILIKIKGMLKELKDTTKKKREKSRYVYFICENTFIVSAL